VERVAAFIDEHYAARLTLDGLAAHGGVSPYYLTALFRRYTGRSVMAYLGDVRHREARSLLRNTDLGVAEVARGVGYEDPYYFSRAFRAREGCPPSVYRREFKPAPHPDG
jgi:iron complex transport system substrate-binding protein